MNSIDEESLNFDLNNIQFRDIFVLEEIQQMQDLFSNATGVASVITDPDGIPITKPSNFCKLCNDIIRNTEKGRMNCYKSDSMLCRQSVNGPLIRTCLSGNLWDAGASITVGGKHIANWLIGQVKSEQCNVQSMMKYADEIGADKDAYLKAMNEVPVMTFDRFNNVAEMLFQFVNNMSEKAYSNLLLKTQILEREKITEELRKSEEKYRLLVENCHDTIYTLDVDGRLTYVSPVWRELLGYTIEEGLGRHYKDLLHPDDIPAFRDYIQKSKDVKVNNQHIEYRIRHKDGTWRWHTTGGMPIRDAKNEVTGYYGAARDISFQKRAESEIKRKNEELLKANEVKDRFFSIIAHDLKSPFNSILGLSQLLADDLDSFTKEEVQNISESIYDTSKNLYRLLENLLQWANIQQDLISVNPDCLILLSVVEESLVIFNEALRNKDIKVFINIQKDTLVYADNNILQTILRNLISNSVKFTPKGGVIEILAKQVDENQVEISVKDSGIGMSPEILASLFKPDISTSRKGTENEPSTGLGLLLCKEFVEKQGGEIFAKSETGKGSEFVFTVNNYSIDVSD
jgi:PAS domain S-box